MIRVNTSKRFVRMNKYKFKNVVKMTKERLADRFLKKELDFYGRLI